ncbi:nitric oxide reductase activation protein NorD [Bdellovibrio bacteriovorus]|uniref:nitric oxide reductase activation protein NorD n=1 Tax=Bdellovibrio bacteriovorus TaxID=959 RepID=UPI0035A86949
MGFDEKFFAFGHKLFKKLTADPKPPHYEQRVDLKDLESRLQVIAKSLCGEPIQIHEAEKIGGFSGVHFYYPKSLCPLPSKRLNELVFIQRTLFYCSAKQLGFCLPPRELSEIEKKVYTCLVIHQVYHTISLEFPGTIQVIETLRQGTLAELQSLSDEDRNTQNGIVAQWIYDLLSENLKDSCWKSIIFSTHKSTFSLWKFADAAYRTHLASLPLGPAVAEEAFVLWGLLMSPDLLSTGEITETDEDVSSETLASGTEVQGRNREDVVQVNLENKKDENSPVSHSFEKTETLEEYQGGMRTQDGDDNLQDHAEALEELNMREVTRSRERTQSLYKADIRIHGVAPDLASKDALPTSSRVHFYPEWDFKRRNYKENWCRVETRSPVSDTSFEMAEAYGKEKKEIAKLFEHVCSKPLWKKRQRDGEELDIDALVNRRADLKSGNSGEDRFYIRSTKHKKDWQCLFLIDSSLSTDSWIANERILDVIKNSICLVSEAFVKEPECLSVAAFHSNTRHQCVFEELKKFDESWAQFRKNLSTLEPVGYTRIGPALRHSLEIMKTSSARHKLIVLLSDGKASDYDQYEGRYGIEDIKQAVREAQQQNVHVKCLAIEEKAKFYLPQMFGMGHIQILSNPHKLPQALTTLLLPLLH